jgi:hypothetical protein
MAHATFASDRESSRAYSHALEDYSRSYVLDGDNFRCRHADACRQSSRASFFGEGQLHHVGSHYAITKNGRPWRIVVCGIENGKPHNHLSMQERSRGIVASGRKRFAERNHHMKGVTSTLRLWFGLDIGADHRGEFVTLDDGSKVHIFEACTLINFLMCTSAEPHRSSRPSTIMKTNCSEHFPEIIRRLNPTLLVCHGKWVSARAEVALKLVCAATVEVDCVGFIYQRM